MTKQPGKTCGRSSVLRFCLLASCLAVWFPAATTVAQPGSARPAAVVERALAAVRGADRIPLLVELATLRRDEPNALDPLTREALELLSAHPSPALESEARVLRSYALEGKSDYPAALAEAQRAERLAGGLNRDDLRANAAYQVGRVEWRMANYAVAHQKAEAARALQSPLGNSTVLARTLNLIGAIYQSESALDAALEHYLAALHMGEAIGDERSAARSHNNIGLVYWDLGRNEEALAALTRALAIHERLGPKTNLVNTLNNVGLVLVELNRPREGMPYLERAFQMDREAGNSYGQAKELSNLGGAAENLKEWDRARDYHRRALALREEIGDKEGIVRSSGALGSLAFRQGDAGAAIPMLQRAVAVAASINDPRDEADNSALLSKALEARGDLAGALAAARRFHDLQTTLNEAESRSRLAELETRYRSRERDRELASLATLADSRRQQLRWVIAGSALLAGCLVLLGILYVLRGRTQRALGESEQRYRALFQNSVIPTFLLDVEHRRVIDLNEPACALCGGAAPGVDIAAIEPEWVRRALTRLFESGAADIIAFDDRWTDAQGALRWTEIRGSAVALGRRACRLVALRDATDLHTREAARQQAENLRSLGVLAGGIAHDFNNALMSISGYVDLAKDADPIERRDMLELAHAAAMAARQLTGQLLSLARGGEPRRRITNVGRLLQDTLTLTGAGSHMRVSVEIPDGLWNAHLDAGQFRHVVSNLVINAQQATAEGGELHVTASNVVGHFGSGASPEAQRFVRLDFADNGKGIPEAIRHQVFDPYFTTKTGGTGLGLTTAFAVCRNHGGMLTFESSEGRGTTFSAFFPATSDAVSDSQPVTATTPDGKGRILVMDDEPMIRNLLSRMLEQWGFSVEAVEDGQRAVDRYAEQLQRGSPFDLLIMDLTIPGGMGGRKAMAEILKSDPHARAIVASGYSDDPTMANYRDAGFVAALAKPFQSAELAEALNVVLKERGQTRTL